MQQNDWTYHTGSRSRGESLCRGNEAEDDSGFHYEMVLGFFFYVECFRLYGFYFNENTKKDSHRLSSFKNPFEIWRIIKCLRLIDFPSDDVTAFRKTQLFSVTNLSTRAEV